MTTGACDCGKIEFEFEGEPINQVFCYCSECQADTGSDKWFGIWVSNDKLRFTKGEPSVYTRMGSSGKPVYKKFCPDCGVHLGGDFTAGGFHSMAVTSIKSGETYRPKMAIFAASAPDWALLPTDIPVHDRFPSGS